MATPSLSTSSPWDAAEVAILRAVQQPAACSVVADSTGQPRDVVKAQLTTFEEKGLVMQPVPGAGRYRLTLAGWKRLFDLVGTTDRPGHQAAA